MQKLKTGLKAILLGIYLLAVSAFLMLAASQAFRLVRLYHTSTSPGPAAGLARLAGSQVRFWSYVLAPVLLAIILFLVTWKRPRRLLVTTLLALLVFGALNLYSGRHLLPRVLIWPGTAILLEEYTQALAGDDLEAALRLTDGSPGCVQATTQAFSEHQALLGERLGPGWQEVGARSSPHRSHLTFYEEPLPRQAILQPAPTQLVRLLVRTDRGKLAWLVGLKVRYKPFLGARYLCGQGIDPEGWRFR